MLAIGALCFRLFRSLVLKYHNGKARLSAAGLFLVNERWRNVRSVFWAASTRGARSVTTGPFIWQALMRQRLQAFLPIVLIALMVQILAPIGAAWAAALVKADPLRGVEICHSQSGSKPADDESRGKPGAASCALCCTAQPATLDGPDLSALDVPRRDAFDVIWRTTASDVAPTQSFTNAQARAPPVV